MPILTTKQVTVSVPFVQKAVDLGATAHKASQLSARREASGTPKVVQNKTSGTLSIKPKGARQKLNLSGVHRAAAQQRKIALNGAVKGGSAPSASTTVQVLAPLAQPCVTPPPPPLTRGEAFAALGLGIEALKDDLSAIGDLHSAARSEGTFSLTAATKEVELLDAQTAAQAKLETLLSATDTLIGASDPSSQQSPTLADLVATRTSLIRMAIAVEYPQTVRAAQASSVPPFPQVDASSDRILAAAVRLHDPLQRLLDPNHPDGPLADPPGAMKKLAKAVDTLTAVLTSNGAQPTGDHASLLAWLKDAQTALGLRTALDKTVADLDSLRQRLQTDPKFDKAKVPVGRLLKEFGHYSPEMIANSASAAPRDQLHALEVLGSLSSLLLTSNVPHLFKSDDPKTQELIKALNVDHCQNLAVAKFLDETDHVALKTAVAQEAIRLGSPPTSRDIERLVQSAAPELKGAFDGAMKNGALAADARRLYFQQMSRLERIVGSGEIASYRPAVWLKLGIPGSGGGPDALRAQATLERLGKKNPEAAFMVAGLAYLESRVAQLDKDVLGLPQYDDLEVAAFDIDRVLGFAGITDKQIQSLGYGGIRYEDRIAESLFNLSRGGFTSVKHLERHRAVFYAAAQETLTNRSVQDMVHNATAQSTLATAQRTGARMMAEAVGVATGLPVSPSTIQPFKMEGGKAVSVENTADVVDGFKKISAAVTGAIGADPAQLQKVQDGAKIFAALDDALGDLLARRAELDTSVADARKRLAAAAGAGPLAGLDTNSKKPGGLRSAKALLRALDAQQELDAYKVGHLVMGLPSAAQLDETVERRDAALQELRGFDSHSMRRPWYTKLANRFRGREAPDIQDLRSLRSAAEDIIFLREGAVANREDIDRNIGTIAELRQDILGDRVAAHPEAIRTVKQMVRAAVLAHWPADNKALTAADGRIEQAYEPALHRAKIEKTLAAWGLDVTDFAPEISDAINSTLGIHDVGLWASETAKIDPDTLLAETAQPKQGGLRAYLRHAASYAFSKEGARDAALLLVHKRAMDEGCRQEVAAIQRSLKDGDKFDFKSGYKLAVNTGKIPLDPSGTVGIRGKMAVSALSNLVMERSSDGYKITARFGAQLGVGLDIIADQKLTDQIAIGASASVDVMGGFLAGYTEVFPDTDIGRMACAEFIMALTNSTKPDGFIFEKVSDAGYNREISGKAGLSRKGYAKAELTAQPFGDDGGPFSSHADDPHFKSGASNKLGIGASVGLELAASLGGKSGVVTSFNKTTISTEREISTGVNLNTNVYAKIVTAPAAAISKIVDDVGAQKAADDRFHKTKEKDDGSTSTEGVYNVGDASTNESLLNADLGAALVKVRKTKQEYTRSDTLDGRDRLTKAEIVERTNLRLGLDTAWFGIGLPELQVRLAQDTSFKESYETLKKQVGGEDNLQITYALTPENLEKVADLLKTSDDLVDEHPFKAAAMRRQAAKILDDADNFEPTKVTLLRKTVTKDVANRGNALLLRVDVTAEVSGEDAVVVLKVPPRKPA